MHNEESNTRGWKSIYIHTAKGPTCYPGEKNTLKGQKATQKVECVRKGRKAKLGRLTGKAVK